MQSGCTLRNKDHRARGNGSSQARASLQLHCSLSHLADGREPAQAAPTQQQPRAWSCPLALPARWGSGHLLSPPRLQRAGSTAGVLRHEGQMSPDRRKVWWKQSSHPWGLLAASSLISLVFSVTNHENWCWPLARLKGKPSRRYTWGHNPENTIFRNEITPTKLTKKHCKGIRDKEGL